MKILITGGAGYIGSVLTQRLIQEGNQVRVLDNLMWGGKSLLPVWHCNNFEFIKGDIQDQSTIEYCLSHIDAVVHLAAIVGDPACSRNPTLATNTNLDASLSIIEAAKRLGISRFIFASTCSNYGRMADPSLYVDEESELQPISIYAETKVAVEQALLDSERSDFTPTICRFATVFGVSPRMRFDLTVNQFTAEMIINKKLEVYGEQFWRPYIHVSDVSRAVSLILGTNHQTIANQVFNIGATDQNYQKRQIVHEIEKVVSDVQIDYVNKNEDPRDYRVSFEKAISQLGFTTNHSLIGGIKEIESLIRNGIISDFRDPIYTN